MAGQKRIPRYCDEVMQVGPLEADEALLIVLALFFGILFSQIVIGFIVAISVPKVLGYFKKNNVRGFMIHMAYWYGVIEAKNLFASNAFERFWVK